MIDERLPLSVKEVQRELRLSRETVSRYLRAGLLRGFRLPSGVWRIPAAEIDRLKRGRASR